MWCLECARHVLRTCADKEKEHDVSMMQKGDGKTHVNTDDACGSGCGSLEPQAEELLVGRPSDRQVSLFEDPKRRAVCQECVDLEDVGCGCG